MKKFLFPTVMLLWQTTVFAQEPAASSGQEIFQEGYRYLMGLGNPLDEQKAILLFKKAADMGNGASLNALGNIYTLGEAGVTADVNTGLAYLKKAMQSGYEPACYNLAKLYKDGNAVEQDFNLSAQYALKGAAAGNASCKNLLAYYYFKGLGIRQNYTNAFNLYFELAKAGDINAQYFTGLCYRNGYGTEANQEAAKKWLNEAAAKGDGQAIHELSAEPLAENSNINTPVLQQRVQSIKNHEEKLITSGSNDLGGTYTGYAVYYDFSGQFVHQVVPLSLSLQKNINEYECTWVENDTLSASIKATFNNNYVDFDANSQYTRCNYYSYREKEKYQFKTANLGIKYLNDSMFLCGNMHFYSISRREPGQPMYIMLGKKVEKNNKLVKDDLQFAVSPNPAKDEVKVTFSIAMPGKVNLRIYSIEGKSVINKNIDGLLPAGTYTYPVDIRGLVNGSYTINVITSAGFTQNKIFIKN